MTRLLYFALVAAAPMLAAGCGWPTAASSTSTPNAPPATAAGELSAIREIDLVLDAERELTSLGICQLDGDTLQLALPFPGDARPAEFKSTADDLTRVMTLKRLQGEPASLEGEWEIVSEIRMGETTDSAGAKIVIDARQMTESRGGRSRTTSYKLGGVAQPPAPPNPQQAKAVAALRKRGATVTLNVAGDADAVFMGYLPNEPQEADVARIFTLTTLRELAIVGEAGVTTETLPAIENMKSLRKLTLESIGGAASDLTPLRSLPMLEELDLSKNAQVDDRSLAALADLKKLKSLSLQQTNVTSSGVATLARLPNLRTLTLSNTRQVDATALEALGEMPQLTDLNLSDNEWVADEAGPVLASLDNLRWLGLGGTRMTNAGLRKIQLLPLRTLSLMNYGPADAPRPDIDESLIEVLEKMTTLEVLDLQRVAWSGDDFSRLQNALPSCRIVGAP